MGDMGVSLVVHSGLLGEELVFLPGAAQSGRFVKLFLDKIEPCIVFFQDSETLKFRITKQYRFNTP
jgi:hypothetical protein